MSRGLNIGYIFSRDGRHVATCVQEGLLPVTDAAKQNVSYKVGSTAKYHELIKNWYSGWGPWGKGCLLSDILIYWLTSTIRT
jgi:hypothetical protein